MHLADEGPVDAALVEPGEGADPVRLLAGDAARQTDRVAADVPQRPTALGRIDARVVRIGQEEREGAVHDFQAAERSVPRELDRPDRLRVVEIHERLDGDPAGPIRGRGDRVHLGDRERERFFAQDVLAGLERPDRPFGVKVVRERDVDDVDVGRRDERVVGRERGRDIVRRRERRAALGVAAGDTDQLGARTSAGRPDEPGSDAARSEDAPAKRGHVQRVRCIRGHVPSNALAVNQHPRRPAPCSPPVGH